MRLNKAVKPLICLAIFAFGIILCKFHNNPEMCPSSLHSCVQGTNFSPIPGEIMSFDMSPVNYSDSDSDDYQKLINLV